MKRILTLLGAALLASALFAQNRVIDTRPAHDGKDLTMEEAIYRGAGYSRAPRFFVDKDGTVSREMPSESPRYTFFTEENSLYGFDESSRESFPIALSNDREIVYGQAVSRNEFGIDGGIFPSPSGGKVAFYRKDESRVTDFPLLDIGSRTGDLRLIKYPMNGMASEHVKLGVYDIEKGSTVYLHVDDWTEERFITNVSWSPDGRFLFAQILDRTQHHLRLNRYDASTGAFCGTLLTEDNDAWVEPLDPIRFLEGRDDLFIYRTDNRDGYRNLYLCDLQGGIRRLTAVDADVEYIGNDGTYVYYTSAEVSPVENHLFRLSVKPGRTLAKARFGKPENLTPERGWHTVQLAGKWFIDRYSCFSEPVRVLKRSVDGKVNEVLFTGEDPLADYASCRVELGTVPSADGLYENYYRLFYPKDFDPAKKYPVILYVYGGPHSQMVQDTWLGGIRMWEMLMAQKGYIVYVQDNRGTSNRGAAFEKAINRRCGQAEMADQMVGVDRLRSLPFVDADRIGVHGWSYGGFMTISLMTSYPDVFKVGVAGGPVIDWKWYEIMYGERYMDTAETNPEGFALTSLVDKAPNLKGHLLICQGAVDNTVVWEHSLSFIQSCIDREIPVDYFPYPVAEHK